MSAVIFLGILFILVLVHELGHFTIAKLTGMRVDEFGIGFPPRLFGIRKGETLYSLNLFPIGGFVKIAGEDGTSTPSSSEVRNDERSFVSKPKWVQMAVLLAGVSMNILLAWVLFVGVFLTGVQTVVTEDQITDNTSLIVTSVLPESPAGKSGIPLGAKIISLHSGSDTLSLFTPTSFQTFISSHGDVPIEIQYVVGESIHTVTLTPEAHILKDAPDQRAVGVALSLVEVVKQPISTALYKGTITTYSTLRDIVVGIVSLLYDSIRFQADFSKIAGPIGIAGLVGEASAFGVTALLMFTAFISLNLAVINVLPFPALDGGRLLFVIIETIKGSPIRPTWIGALNAAGFVLLILLMIAVTYNDVIKLI